MIDVCNSTRSIALHRACQFAQPLRLMMQGPMYRSLQPRNIRSNSPRIFLVHDRKKREEKEILESWALGNKCWADHEVLTRRGKSRVRNYPSVDKNQGLPTDSMF